MRSLPLAALRRALAPLAAAVFLAVPAARGQVSWCDFPEPLSSTEITAMLDRVGIEGAGRDSAMKAFEEYLTATLAIARDEIAPFCAETAGPANADDREIERRIDVRRRLSARLRQAETTLADAVARAAGTPGEIRAGLERERLERRHWMRLVGGRWGQANAEFVDWLGERAIDVNDELLAVLAARSGELTAQWRKLATLAAETPLATRRLVEARGLKRPDSSEQADWQRFFQDMAQAREDAAAPQREARLAIRRNARETERSLAALLPAPDAAALHAWFLERNYPSLLRPRDPVPPLVAEAERKASAGDLSAETLAELRTIAATHATRRAELDVKAMDELDARGKSETPGLIVFGDTPREADRADELLAERGKLDAATLAQLRAAAPALAPPAEADRESPRIMVNGMEIQLDEAAVAGGGAFVIQADVGGGLGGGVAMIAMSSAEMGGGRAKPISREDLAAWSRRLGVPDDSMPLLEVLLEDYRGKYAEIESGPLAELGSSSGPFGNPEIPAARRSDLQREATERLLALDAEFFANLAAARAADADPEAVTRLANERQRSVHRDAMRGSSGFSPLSMQESQPFDLVTAVAEAGLPDATVAALDAVLVAYDGDMTPLLSSSYARTAAAARTVAIEQEKYQKIVEEESDSGAVRTVTGSSADLPEAEAMERQRAAQREIDAVQAAIRTAQDAAVARALAAAPEGDDRTRLADALDRAAYPQLFRDGRSAGPRFEAALALPDLTPDRRSAIETAFAAWRSEWRRITGAMIESRRRLATEAGSRGEGADAMPLLVANQEAMQRLRFERSEVNEKGMRALKPLLTPEQAAQVGDLPPAPKRGPIMFGN
jgi:hypothetical protein